MRARQFDILVRFFVGIYVEGEYCDDMGVM